MTLGEKLSEKRRAKNMTQDDVAEKLGVTPQAVSKWENDQSCPDILSLPQLARELHTTVDALLTGQSAVEAPAANVSSRRAATNAAPIRYVTLRSPSRSLDDVAVPCVEGDLNDLATLRANRADVLDVPPSVVEALQTPGGRVHTIRDELRFPLDDGRTIVLPVDVYEIRSEFIPIY